MKISTGQGQMTTKLNQYVLRMQTQKGNSQACDVEKVIDIIIDAQGEQSFSGIVITADRGYGEMSLVPALAKKGIGFLFIMPEHLLMCHSFVCASQFHPVKIDIDGVDAEDYGHASRTSLHTQYGNNTMLYDREKSFVIDESLKIGNLCKRAEKVFKNNNSGFSVRVTNVALRERGHNQVRENTSFCLLSSL